MPRPVQTEYLEPETRILHDWTPDLVRAAWQMAQSGNLRLAAELCNDILSDDSITGTLEKRTRGVIRLPLDFEPAKGAGKRTPIIKASLEDWYIANPEDEHTQLEAWGLLLGVGLAELIWTERNGRAIPVLKTWNPKHLRWNPQMRSWMLRTLEGEIPITPGDGKWLLYTPFGNRRPWERGKWRSVAMWYLIKRYAITDWARYSEKNGMGVFTGHTSEAKAGDKKARQDFADQLRTLGSNGTVVMPPGFDVKLIEAVSGNWATFRAQIQMADEAIAVALVGQNLTTRVQGGSRAAATVHERIEADLIEGDTKVIANTHREQQWLWWAEFNYGSRDLCPWPKYDPTPPAEQREIQQWHAEAGAVSKNEIRVSVGLTPREDELMDELFVLPVAPQPDPNAPTDAHPAPPEDPKKKNAKALNLASGAKGKAAKAFRDGQVHADGLADAALEHGLPHLKADAARVLDAVFAATDYEGLRSALIAAFDDLDPAALEERMSQALVLADLTGRWAVLEDA